MLHSTGKKKKLPPTATFSDGRGGDVDTTESQKRCNDSSRQVKISGRERR